MDSNIWMFIFDMKFARSTLWMAKIVTALDNQPTYGDNPTARNRRQPKPKETIGMEDLKKGSLRMIYLEKFWETDPNKFLLPRLLRSR